jgi:hypothetical protein
MSGKSECQTRKGCLFGINHSGPHSCDEAAEANEPAKDEVAAAHATVRDEEEKYHRLFRELQSDYMKRGEELLAVRAERDAAIASADDLIEEAVKAVFSVTSANCKCETCLTLDKAVERIRARKGKFALRGSLPAGEEKL